MTAVTENVWSVDARTGAEIEIVATASTLADVDAVATRAAAAAPALTAAGLAGRARLLRAMATELEHDGEQIVAAADRETALGTARLTGELARTAFQLRLFAEVVEDGGYLGLTIDHADAQAAPAPRPDLRRMLIPLGPVAVFAASNFPLAFSVPGGDTASAIAAGCPVVVKAHPGHPYTSHLCASALRRAAATVGLPEDVVQLVHGFDAGPALVTHPAITAVGFTGSVAGGRALFDLAVGRSDPIPFYGELGSVNPLVVTPAAAAERAEAIATGLAGSFTQGVGQFCTKPGLAFVPADDNGRRLADALATAASQTALGAMLTAGIRERFTTGASERSELTHARSVPAGDAVVLVTTATQLDGALVEECFGPLVVVVEYRDEAELSAALARVPGSLTATVHIGSEEREDSFADRIARQLTGKAGRVLFDGFPTGVAVTWAMQHGGPWPATTSARDTSVGTAAIERFVRPVTYQGAPDALLPAELRESNPLRLPRRVDGVYRLDA